MSIKNLDQNIAIARPNNIGVAQPQSLIISLCSARSVHTGVRPCLDQDPVVLLFPREKRVQYINQALAFQTGCPTSRHTRSWGLCRESTQSIVTTSTIFLCSGLPAYSRGVYVWDMYA